MKSRVSSFFIHKATIAALLLLLAAFITFQNIHSGVKHFWGGDYTFYNNYVIFKNSWYHLVAGTNLYDFYHEYADLYKYSPAFAFLMGPFAALPDPAGLFLWNLLNIFTLFFALNSLPLLTDKKRLFIVLFILQELVVATQNSQSNALLAGLMLFAFTSLEKNKIAPAALFIVLGGFIKVFSFAGVLLFLLYPKKLKSVFFLSLWFVVLLALPLLVNSPSQLLQQYENWWILLKSDHAASTGMSIYIYTAQMLNAHVNKMLLLGAGIIALLAPLARFKKFKEYRFRLSFLSLLLVWMVIFNHKAESPSYIIAMSGIACWGISASSTRSKKILLVITFFLTSAWTMIFPGYGPVYVKPLMPVLVFGIILAELLRPEPEIPEKLSFKYN